MSQFNPDAVIHTIEKVAEAAKESVSKLAESYTNLPDESKAAIYAAGCIGAFAVTRFFIDRQRKSFFGQAADILGQLEKQMTARN